MARSFSSKKVARASRMGGTRRRGAGTAYGWYASLLAIAIVGSGFVFFSRAERLDATNPGSTPPLAPSETRTGDQWFEAVGFYTCDKFAPDLAPQNDPYGITAAQGVIRIAPNEKKYAGRNATLGLLAKGADVALDRDSFVLPGDTTKYGPGTKCGDKDAKLVVREWTKASDPTTGKTSNGNPATLLLKDRYAVTVAWVPNDFDENNVPIPNSAATLDQVASQAQQGSQAPTSSTPATDPAATATTTPAAPVTTAAP